MKKRSLLEYKAFLLFLTNKGLSRKERVEVIRSFSSKKTTHERFDQIKREWDKFLLHIRAHRNPCKGAVSCHSSVMFDLDGKPHSFDSKRPSFVSFKK